MLYLGIDPGKTGYAAVWDSVLGTLLLFPAPLKTAGQRRTKAGNVAQVTEYDLDKMAGFFWGLSGHPVRGAIELVATRPGVVGQQDAMLSGMGYGLWRGMAAVAGIPLEQVASNLWKRDVFSLPQAQDLQPPPTPDKALDLKTRNNLLNKRQVVLKKNACLLATRLFPTYAAEFRHASVQDGAAEAALIAYWLAGECSGRWNPKRSARRGN